MQTKIETQGVFKYVVAKHFLPTFCDIAFTSMTRHKLRGIDGNGKPVDFNEEEKAKINQGLKRLAITLILK